MTGIDILIDLSWKSVLIAGTALLAAVALRGYAPRYRAALCNCTLLGLLALPAIMLVLPAIELALPTALQSARLDPIGAMATPLADTVAGSAAIDIGQVVTIVYSLGALALLGYLALGVILLAKLTHRGSDVATAQWLAPLARLRRSHGLRNVKLRCSDGIDSPLSWGWLRPSIVIDRDNLERPHLAEGILAHELAHIVRYDWPMLVGARIALALFWFNPLVWLLVRRATDLAEQAADASAVRQIDRLTYARTLTQCARADRTLKPATAIAASPDILKRRIRLLIDDHMTPFRQGLVVPALAMLACTGTGVLLASTQLTILTTMSGGYLPDPLAESQSDPAVPEAPPAIARLEPGTAGDQASANAASDAILQPIATPPAAGSTKVQSHNPRMSAEIEQGNLPMNPGAVETQFGDRRTQAGDAMTRRGIFETKRGQILTRLGDMETKWGEEQNRRAAARHRSENNGGGSGGPAP